MKGKLGNAWPLQEGTHLQQAGQTAEVVGRGFCFGFGLHCCTKVGYLK